MTMSIPDDDVLALRRLLAVSVTAHEALAGRLGLNPTDLRCLLLATTEGEMTPSRLADLSDLTSGAVTGVLDRLERAGYVHREPDPDDRRRLLVRLEPNRLAELETAFRPMLARALASAAEAGTGRGADAGLFLAALANALVREAEVLHIATHGGILDDAYQAPRAEVTRARLVVHTGAPRLNVGAAPFGQQVRMVAETAGTRLLVRSADEGDELLRASFVGPPPEVRTADGTVTMRYKRRVLDVRSREVKAALHRAPAWAIEVENGLSELDADLSDLAFLSLEVHGGVNRFRLRLPRPSGTVRIAIDGGVSEGRITRPTDVPVMLVAGGGVSQLRFDGESRSASGSSLRVRSRSYDKSPDRYEIEIEGGISDLTIDPA
jgi:DNA-binding MarR family transcriptional regulator